MYKYRQNGNIIQFNIVFSRMHASHFGMLLVTGAFEAKTDFHFVDLCIWVVNVNY